MKQLSHSSCSFSLSPPLFFLYFLRLIILCLFTFSILSFLLSSFRTVFFVIPLWCQGLMCGITWYLSYMISSPLLKSTYLCLHSARILSYLSLGCREQTLFDSGTKPVTTRFCFREAVTASGRMWNRAYLFCKWCEAYYTQGTHRASLF